MVQCLYENDVPSENHIIRLRSPPPSLEHRKAVVEKVVSEIFSVDISLMRHGSRGDAPVALARQVAMYLTHCAFSVSLTDVGRAFARDRTTVAHACRIIEDRRDDANFDYLLSTIEEIVYRVTRISGTSGEI
jgi:chromosomal replication initiation ATPase DnaA